MFLNARRLDGPDGMPERILLGIEDVTERQRAAEGLAAIVESSEDAVVSQDLDGRIISWNPAVSSRSDDAL